MKYITLIGFTFLSICSIAQDISREAVSIAGNFFDTDNGSISWTMGESVIATLTGETTVLTQGFQQDNLTVSTLLPETQLGRTIQLYPNPVTDILNINTEENNIHVQLLNIHGEVIKTETLKLQTGELDFSVLPNGTYILKVNGRETHKIIKQ